jgi:hypothetical protein
MKALASLLLIVGTLLFSACRGDDGDDSPDGSISGSDGDSDADADSDTDADADSDGDADCEETGADARFSFFLSSWYHMQLLSGTRNGFGGDLRYNGAATGLEGADAICQRIAANVCFGHLTWHAFLSTSQVDAIDRIGDGPWYDYAGQLVANDVSQLTSGNRPAGGCCESGVYDELGVFHDGSTDVNNDGMQDDDHDILTGSNEQGRYDGFSCDDWTSTTAQGSGRRSGPMCGHSWPAHSGENWIAAHSVSGCAAEVNFIQDGGGSGDGVGSGGGYGGIYCFAE